MAQRFGVEALLLLHLLAQGAQPRLVVVAVVGTEVGQRGTFAKTREAHLCVGRSEHDVPHTAGEVHPARRACGLLELQHARHYTQTEGEEMHELYI